MSQVPGTIPDLGIDFGWRQFFQWPRVLLSARSVEHGSPLATIRDKCAESYITVIDSTFKYAFKFNVECRTSYFFSLQDRCRQSI